MNLNAEGTSINSIATMNVAKRTKKLKAVSCRLPEAEPYLADHMAESEYKKPASGALEHALTDLLSFLKYALDLEQLY